MSRALRVHPALASQLALIVVLVGWHLPRTDFTQPRAWLGLLIPLPLFLPLRGIARSHAYTCAWATLLVVPYLGYSIVEIIANPAQRGWAIATAAIGLVTFWTLIATIRAARSRDDTNSRSEARRRCS